MKNVEIAEGGIGRRLSGTKFVLTDKPESDQMEVWVDEDDRKLVRLYATSNGTYYPEDQGAYGFSSVTVSIHGGATLPEMPKIEMPDGTIAPVLIPEIEMPDGTLKPIDELFPEIAEDPLTDIGEVKVPDTVGEEGSAITGIDPEDGYTYKVEVDEAGNLDVEKVPTDIKITQPPNKTEYEFGDDVDYDGMEISLVDKDGNIVKTKEYPTGKVPLDDESLDLPTDEIPEITDRSEVKGTWTAKSGLSVPDLICTSEFTGIARYDRWKYVYNYGGIMMVEYAPLGKFNAVFVGPTQDSVWRTEEYTRTDVTTGEVIEHSKSTNNVSGARSYTYAGKTVYYMLVGASYSFAVEQTLIVDKMQDVDNGPCAWTAMYGDMTANQELEAEWTSPYSGVVYKDGTTVVTSEPKKDE